jgi:hypothetical protein
VPSMDPTQERSAGTPEIPSFASLRGPARRSPVDLLLPGEPLVVASPATPPVAPATAPAAPSAAPRPPEWADLLHLAVHVLRWSFGVPARQVRRLLGG